MEGKEQWGSRPVLVISDTSFNAGPAELVTILPLTKNRRPMFVRVFVDPPEGGLVVPSSIICEQTRTLSRERLKKRMGAVSAKTMKEVEEKLRFLLVLPAGVC